MRVVITGGLGHVGSALLRAPQLTERAREIVIVDDLSTQRYASLMNLPKGPRYVFVEGDLCDQLDARMIEGATSLVHLAAFTDPTSSFDRPEFVFDTNLRLTRHVTKVCEQAGVPLIFASSTSVYTDHASVLEEESSTEFPASPYAQCKLAEEALIRASCVADAQGIIFRFGTIYGPSPGMRFHTAVNKFCWQAATGQPISVWTTALHQRRPYLAVWDAARALARAALGDIRLSGVVNVVSDNVTVRDVLEHIEQAGFHPEVKLIEHAAMNDLSFRIDSQKARGAGLELTGDIGRGVRMTLKKLGHLGRP